MGALMTDKNRVLAGLVVVALAVLVAGMILIGGSNSANGEPPQDVLQVLNLRISGEPQTLDPALAAMATDGSVVDLLFSGLFGYDTDLHIMAKAAAEVPTVENGGISADGLTYTVKLRDGLTWSDGSALTASDFVYSLKRSLDPRVGSPFAGAYGAIAGAPQYFGAFGFDPEHPVEVSDADLAALRDAVGITAPDDTTIVYTLSQPDPSFLNILALPAAFPVKQSVVESGPDWIEAGKFIGNGPFILQTWDHDQRLVLGANTHWLGDTPFLSTVNLEIIKDDAAAYAAYLAGELDAVSVPAASVQDILDPSSDLNKELVQVPQLFTFALMTNAAQPPFDNELVRKAFDTAIDRNAFVEGVLQGAGNPTTAWLPPGMPGYDPSVGSQYEFDPAKAKQLLADAGYPNGEGLPEIVISTFAVPPAEAAGAFVQDQLAKNLGVNVKFDYLDPPVFGARFGQNQHQAALVSWGATWPYPDSFLTDLLTSTGTNNHSGYSNPEFDRLIDEASKETDDAKRLDLYEQAHKLAIDDAALIPLYNKELMVLVKPRVNDLIISPVDGPVFGELFLAKTYVTQ